MAIKHVEIHEIGEDEAFAALRKRLRKFGNAVGIVLSDDEIGNAAAVVDVVDFADTEDGHAALGENIEKHGARRLDGVVVATLSAAIISRRPREGASNHAADAMRAVEKFARNFAHAI